MTQASGRGTVSSTRLAPPDAARLVMRRARWRLSEIVFWIAAFATVFLLPGRHLILTEIAILGLFARAGGGK